MLWQGWLAHLQAGPRPLEAWLPKNAQNVLEALLVDPDRLSEPQNLAEHAEDSQAAMRELPRCLPRLP